MRSKYKGIKEIFIDNNSFAEPFTKELLSQSEDEKRVTFKDIGNNILIEQTIGTNVIIEGVGEKIDEMEFEYYYRRKNKLFFRDIKNFNVKIIIKETKQDLSKLRGVFYIKLS